MYLCMLVIVIPFWHQHSVYEINEAIDAALAAVKLRLIGSKLSLNLQRMKVMISGSRGKWTKKTFTHPS